MLTLQSANLCEIQGGLVPNPSVDSDLNFVRLERIGIILIELDSAVGEWTLGVEEKRAIGKRKLKGDIGSILWTSRRTTRPVWVARSVGMMWPMGVARSVRMIRPMGMIRPVGMIRSVGMLGIVGVVGVIGFTGMVWVIRSGGKFRVVRSGGMARWMRMVGLAGMVRVVGRLGPIGATGAVAVAVRAMRFDLHRLRPVSMFVAFQFLVRIKTSLKFPSTFHVCCAKAEGIHTHKKSLGTVLGIVSRSVKSGNSISCDL